MIGAGAVLLLAPAPMAAAVAAGDEVWIGDSFGYPGSVAHAVYVAPPADPDAPGPASFWAYCIEHDISARTHTPAITGDYASYLGTNNFADPAVQARVYWIITHSYPAVSLEDLATASGVATVTLDDAAQGTQYAIWDFTDLAGDPDTPWLWDTPESEAVTRYLAGGAVANAGSSPPAIADVEVTVSGPTASGSAGGLLGPFVISTNQASVSVATDPAYPVTDGTGAPVDVDAVVDGQEVFLDLRSATAAGSATLTATAAGAGGTGLVISVPETDGVTPTVASHAQSMILVAAATATTSDSAAANWAGTASGTPTHTPAATDGHDELADSGVEPPLGATALGLTSLVAGVALALLRRPRHAQH